MRRVIAGGVVWMLIGAAGPARGQTPSARAPNRVEELQLAALQRDARAADARAREAELLAKQTDLRLHNIDVERYPSISTLGVTQYASDAPTAPFNDPNGNPAFAAPRFTYDASVRVDQRLYDAAIGPRRELARADLAESRARVNTALFSLRQEVNEAFFAAALLQEQLGALEATLDGLDARLRETTRRVQEGAALPADAAALEATLLQQRQQADALRSTRRAAMARLGGLTGRTIDPAAVLQLPAPGLTVAELREAMLRSRARPEFEQFDRARDRALRQQEVAAAGDRPLLSAFGRGGFGKPGLNFANEGSEAYALVGVQVQWKAWTWGASGRERDALALQQAIVSAEEASFTSAIRRAIEADLATIEHLEASLPADDRIVALREGIDRTARVRLDEGVITASEYLDRHTEWLAAQFDRARHRVELAQARAGVQTKLGLEVQ